MLYEIRDYLFLRKITRRFKKPLRKVYPRKLVKYNLRMVRVIYQNIAKRYGVSVRQIYDYLPLDVKIDYDMEMAYGLCEARTDTIKKLFHKPVKLYHSTIYLNGQDTTTTTFIHECGHYLRYLIAYIAMFARNKKAFKDFIRVVDIVRSRSDAYTKRYDHFFTRGTFTEDEEENFAKSWELYLRNGVSPIKKHQKLFDDFRKYIFDDMYKRNERRKYEYYRDLEVQLTPERKKFFDELLVGKRMKEEPLFLKILEIYIGLAILFIIYKLIIIYI